MNFRAITLMGLISLSSYTRANDIKPHHVVIAGVVVGAACYGFYKLIDWLCTENITDVLAHHEKSLEQAKERFDELILFFEQSLAIDTQSISARQTASILNAVNETFLRQLNDIKRTHFKEVTSLIYALDSTATSLYQNLNALKKRKAQQRKDDLSFIRDLDALIMRYENFNPQLDFVIQYLKKHMVYFTLTEQLDLLTFSFKQEIALLPQPAIDQQMLKAIRIKKSTCKYPLTDYLRFLEYSMHLVDSEKSRSHFHYMNVMHQVDTLVSNLDDIANIIKGSADFWQEKTQIAQDMLVMQQLALQQREVYAKEKAARAKEEQAYNEKLKIAVELEKARNPQRIIINNII